MCVSVCVCVYVYVCVCMFVGSKSDCAQVLITAAANVGIVNRAGRSVCVCVCLCVCVYVHVCVHALSTAS